MKIGFIQDIHGNLEALQAVLNDLYGKHKVDYIFCLGDMINYGPNPNEVMQVIYQNDINFILGEEEYTLLYPQMFYPNLTDLARNCAEWTRQVINEDVYSYIKAYEFNEQGGDNRCIYGEDFVAVHCSMKDILPKAQYGIYVDNEQEARDNLSLLMANKKQVMFYGHTHKPRVDAYSTFTGKTKEHIVTSNYTQIKLLKNHYYLINFGSVGFPRDFINLASYGVLNVEDSLFEIHRIPYDINTFMNKLEMIQAPLKVKAWAANGGFVINDK